MKTKLKICEAAALVALSIALCTGTWAEARQRGLAGELVRLHVLAHSDEKQEQLIKLRVRDAVLDYLQPRLEGAESSIEAQQLIACELEGIARAAASVSEGRRVSVSLGTERYPTRQYDNFALPAGEYRSLKVSLGDGAGENWWCVAFPPLCTGAVSERLSPAMSSEDMRLITGQGGYRLGFRSIELWDKFKDLVEAD